MTVWTVYFSDCRFEGGSVEAIFSTEEKATTYALARVAQEQELANMNHREWVLDYPDHHHEEPDKWVLEDQRVWGNGMALICVNAIEVDSDVPARKYAEQLENSRKYHAERMADSKS